MLIFIRFFEGPYVLRNAHPIDADSIKINSFFGKVSGVGIPTNIDLCSVMPQPTQVPMITPENELESTKMKAS